MLPGICVSGLRTLYCAHFQETTAVVALYQSHTGHYHDSVSCFQIGDQADAEAQRAEARQEELLTKEFASKARTTEHRSESHEEVKDGQVTSSSSKSEDKKDGRTTNKTEQHSGAVAEGAGVTEKE